MTTAEFIARHRLANTRELALQARRYPDVDMPYALNQIQGWQTARHKLPSWAACDGVVYPPHINMEQCSSEATARYKQDVARRWAEPYEGKTSMADLTGGFGVDFSFVSRCFDEATYIERDPALCDTARANMPRLGIGNARVTCADSAAWLARAPRQTMLFADPARRDTHGAKTVLVSDCTPDVGTLLPLITEKSAFAMIKLSPMLDWHKAVDDLHGTVREVHIVSVGGECKELLLVLAATPAGQGLRVVCADIQPRPDADGEWQRTVFAYSHGGTPQDTTPCDTAPQEPHTDDNAPQYLYEPNASVMKAGCFGEIERAYGMRAVSANSHLFMSERRVDTFPGRRFAIDTVTTMNKRQLRDTTARLERANIAVRNFPMTADALRKRLKLRDGGNTYIFATTTRGGEHILLVTHKA